MRKMVERASSLPVATNPILGPSRYIADGEVHVFGDRVYLFGSHDREGGSEFCMEDYEFFSAPVDDLTLWSSRGVNYSPKADPLWSPERAYAYAPDVVRGNDGRFYLYYCLAGYEGPISVAVSDEPDGHYQYLGCVRNADGTPLLRFVPFDPAVMNDDGTIRLWYGCWWPFDELPKPFHPLMFKVESGMFGKTPEEIASEPGGIMGPVSCTLEDDMLTVATEPKRILPARVKGTPFAGHFAIPAFASGHGMVGHAFFESLSMRKIGDRYIFVYSSLMNHELCYATSRYPDRDFQYGGVLVSNGDVGVEGRRERDRANATGTTHGSIECVKGQWHVFYHRLTHGSDWSRQMCAEKIYPAADSTIAQAEMTSSGLNAGDLPGRGSYSATICCHLTNGHMPHLGNRSVSDIPMVTHEREGEKPVRYVSGLSAGSHALYRYFDLTGSDAFEITARGDGTLEVVVNGRSEGALAFRGEKWETKALALSQHPAHAELMLRCTEGSLDLLSFGFLEGRRER